ncbi:unnamed protein product [Urochloa humidicola]
MEAPTSPLDGTILKLPGKLDRLLHHGCALPKGVADEIPLIKHDLEKIMAISSNLEDDCAMMVRCWRKEVRELSYDTEDFVDQFEHAAASVTRVISIRGRKITKRRKGKTTLPWIQEKLRQRLWMANKIKEFSARTQEILQRYKSYKLDAMAFSASAGCTDAYPTSWCATPCGEENTYVGISAAMEKLEELPKHDHGQQNLKIVSIVGFGGIGKTTLAMELYCKLAQQFECRAFVRTSQKPDMRRIFISMLSQVCPHKPPDNWTVHSLISSIRTHLQDKRYLIIVEDLCATSTWDIIKCALPDSNCCSRILTTTENEGLALQSCNHDPKHVYKIPPLAEDNSKKLFFSSVFGPQEECPPELREISHDIIRKCGGLPLAIATVASILSCQPSIQDRWDYVNKAIGYSLLTNPTWEGMKQVLDLSYNSLPHHLKACILYTGMYEEDIVIWKDDLVNQWIAEGFIRATEGQDKKEIARSFFDRLISGKLILPVDINKNGEVLSCTVHHMVLNLVIRSRSVEENFVTAIHHSQAHFTLADKVRRLSLQFGNAEDAMPPANMRLSHVRTIAFWGVFKCLPSIVQFRLLQVLILHFWGENDTTSFDLTGISELFRLRYLKVTSNMTLQLCTQMRGLKSLETLTIDAKVCAVPPDIVQLPGLLHLSLPAETILPNGIGQMTSLRTLGIFDLSSNSAENAQSLSMLTNLEDLQLTGSTVQPENPNNKMEFLLNSIIMRLGNLKSVTLAPRSSVHAKSTDDAGAAEMTIPGGFSSVSCVSTFLQSLEVSPRICMFFCAPKWIGQILKLSILKIGITKIDRDDVDVLKGLPSLAVLSLYVQTKPAARIVFGNTGFPVIKYFKFKCCDPWLKFEEGAMPNLRKLKLVFNACNADQQSTIPVGIKYLSDLKEVSAKIGGDDPEESYRRAAEWALRDAIRVHARCQRINVQCVKKIIGGKDVQSSIKPQVEDYGTQKQYKIKYEKDSKEHVEIKQQHCGQEVDTDADIRSTFSELHILLLLRNKLDNQHNDITRSIPIVDVYSNDPWNLAKIGTMHYGGQSLFFRPLQKASADVLIKTPSGYWKVTGLPGYIHSSEKRSIGMKRTMEFYRGHEIPETKTKWKIKELMAFPNAAAGEICAFTVPSNEMSMCQLYIELAANPAGGSASCSSPESLPHDGNLATKQNKITEDDSSEKGEIIQKLYMKTESKQQVPDDHVEIKEHCKQEVKTDPDNRSILSKRGADNNSRRNPSPASAAATASLITMTADMANDVKKNNKKYSVEASSRESNIIHHKVKTANEVMPYFSPATTMRPLTSMGASVKLESDHSNLDVPSVREVKEKQPWKNNINTLKRMEMELQYPEKLNQLYCELRSMLPNASKTDEASLMGDAISYINELRGKLAALEHDKNTLRAQVETLKKERDDRLARYALKIDTKILGLEAMISVQCHKSNHPSARLMTALRELDLEIYHASVTVVKDLMIQKVAVKMVGRIYYSQEQLNLALYSHLAEPNGL